LIRFVELSRHLSFRESVADLQEELAPTAQLLAHTVAFYQLELHRYPEGVQYLAERGVCDARHIEELGIGYASGPWQKEDGVSLGSKLVGAGDHTFSIEINTHTLASRI
jgi:hypothetical protein